MSETLHQRLEAMFNRFVEQVSWIAQDDFSADSEVSEGEWIASITVVVEDSDGFELELREGDE